MLFVIDLLWCVFSLTCCGVFCHRLFVVCFVVDLLHRVVVLSTVSFLMVFVLAVHMTKYDLIESSNQIMFVSMLQIWNLRYFRHYWIIKCVGLELIIFVINMDVASSSKVLSIFYSVFLSIVLLI